MTVQKSVTLPEELAEFVDERNISISGFVQDKLRERKEKIELLEEADLEGLANGE